MTVNNNSDDKIAVKSFWEAASCGEDLYLKGAKIQDYDEQSAQRYDLEPYIETFADFENHNSKMVLEIGVGLGADHQRFAQAGAICFGVDLTERAIAHTKKRLELNNLHSSLKVGDAERLTFRDNCFDCVYSWGVLHHSPNTETAISEVHRVLKDGGQAKVMIYHKYSMIGLMLYLRYGLFRLRPFITLNSLYSNFLESPGTKAYTKNEALRLFSKFEEVEIETILTHGDLLQGQAGQRHRGILLSVARSIWPRWLIKTIFPKFGLFMLISARK